MWKIESTHSKNEECYLEETAIHGGRHKKGDPFMFNNLKLKLWGGDSNLKVY